MYSIIDTFKKIADEDFTVYIDHDNMSFRSGMPETTFYKTFHTRFLRIEEKIKGVAEVLFEEMLIMSSVKYNRSIMVSSIIEIIKRNMVIV